MTQEKLNEIHESIMALISHYLSGILTTVEFKQAIEKIGAIENLTDLTDPATGLRYKAWMNN
jgi:hypothetical protein